MRLPFVVLFASATAFAQPKPAARVPTRPVPCAKDDLKLFASGLDAVVCWDKGCMKLDMSQTDASWIVKPAAPKPWMIPVAEVKDTQVCLGTTCKPLGRKLLQAIADYKKNLDPTDTPTFDATSDLKAVMFGHNSVWSVPADKQIKFTPAASYSKTDKPSVGVVTVVGDLLVVNWYACAGPCTQFSIVDSSGRPKGPTGAAGGPVFQLDAKRFVVLSEYAEVQVFELGTAKPRGALQLHGEPAVVDAIRVDDDTILVMHGKPDGKQVTKVSLSADKKISPSIYESMFLPRCNP